MHPQNTQDQAPPDAVERAARAVWKHWNPIAPAWNDAREQDRDEARAQARAALAAALPPTTTEWGVQRRDGSVVPHDYAGVDPDFDAEYLRALGGTLVSREVTDWREVTP